jgi:hypothetical protein
MLVFAAEASTSKAVLVGVFTSSLTLALLTVRVLDFPFESQRDARKDRSFDCGRSAAWLTHIRVSNRVAAFSRRSAAKRVYRLA